MPSQGNRAMEDSDQQLQPPPPQQQQRHHQRPKPDAQKKRTSTGTRSSRSGSHSTQRSKNSSVVNQLPSTDLSLQDPTPPPEPARKRTAKTKHRTCPLCDIELPQSWDKKLCDSCIGQVLCEETPNFASELRSVIKTEVESVFKTLKGEKKVSKEKPNPYRNSDSSSSDIVNSDTQDSSFSSSDDERGGRHCFPLDEVDGLVKAVRSTMGVLDPRPDKTVQDVMFGGLCQKKRKVFPLNENIQTLIKREWEKPERKNASVPSIKRKYPFEEEASSSWDKAPKLDVAVAKASKRYALPFEDMGTLKDPLDKRADTFLKGAWESAGGCLRPAIAAACTSRSLMIWIDNLEKQLRDGVPRNKVLDSIPMIRGAAAFLADSSADSIKLTSKSAALSNAARRTLWLKSWPGDLQTKHKLCSIPCEGKFLFGETLDDILQKAGDKKKGFPILPQTFNKRPFRSRKFFRRRPPREQNRSDDGKRRERGFLFGSSPRDKKPPPLSDISPRVGGRLSQFLPAWEKITTSPWILNLINAGLQIEFFSLPPRHYVVTPLRSSPQQQEALELEILKLFPLWRERRVSTPHYFWFPNQTGLSGP
ncbi:uncharacterized protein LOC143807535 [Ranitomeya variabilis]|uniref:uncharacterized protein LOC143807535 n=1 Tax=Ranitomeya variabilis TaxID=490064 RepID=UPI004057A4D9